MHPPNPNASAHPVVREKAARALAGKSEYVAPASWNVRTQNVSKAERKRLGINGAKASKCFRQQRRARELAKLEAER